MNKLATAIFLALSLVNYAQNDSILGGRKHSFAFRFYQNYMTLLTRNGFITEENNYYLYAGNRQLLTPLKDGKFSTTDFEFTYRFQCNPKHHLELFFYLSLIPETGEANFHRYNDYYFNYYQKTGVNIMEQQVPFTLGHSGIGMNYAIQLNKGWTLKAGLATQYIQGDLVIKSYRVYDNIPDPNSNNKEPYLVTTNEIVPLWNNTIRLNASIQKKLNLPFAENLNAGFQMNLFPTIQPSVYLSYEY